MADLAVIQHVLVLMVWEMDISHFAAIDKDDFGTQIFCNNIGTNNKGANQYSADHHQNY